MNINALKKAIESLPEEDYGQLRRWFADKEWEKWDIQLTEDSKSGKLDFLIKEAFEVKQEGKLKDL